MADMFSKAERSRVMAAIRSDRNKSTELALMEILREARIHGWRRRRPLHGKPDFVFRRERVVVFVDGCFWHGCPRCAIVPKSNREYWDAKLNRNRQRDREVSRELRRLGWRVVRIWHHELKYAARVARRLRAALSRE